MKVTFEESQTKFVQPKDMSYGKMYVLRDPKNDIGIMKPHVGRIFMRIYSCDGIRIFLLENTYSVWHNASNIFFEELPSGTTVTLTQD